MDKAPKLAFLNVGPVRVLETVVGAHPADVVARGVEVEKVCGPRVEEGLQAGDVEGYGIWSLRSARMPSEGIATRGEENVLWKIRYI